MCGLTGLMLATPEAPERLRGTVQRMADAVAHRGPDAAGVWVHDDGHVAFGFRRLAILDLSPAGHQPMHSASGRYTIVFNGEIYGATALRDRLAGLGHTFRGRSDTEVILAAVEEWGLEAALPQLHGMFAIALYDAADGSLAFARDRLGKKPLYLLQDHGRIAFASELRSLRALAGFSGRRRPAAVARVLSHLCVPAPHAIYEGVWTLPPGHWLTVRGAYDDVRAWRPYWTPAHAAAAGRAAPWMAGDAAAVEAGDALLLEAVRDRLVADVPVGALLSGGVDSSAVVAAMQAVATQPVRTYAVRFAAGGFDESAHAERVAEHLGTTHTTFALGDDDLLRVVPHLPELFDEPHADPSALPTYLISALARRDVTVALTGDGGDEVFGGYNRYVHGARLFAGATLLPRVFRRAMSRAAGAAPTLARVGGVAASTQQPASVRAGRLRQMLRADGRAAMYHALMSTGAATEVLVPGAATLPAPELDGLPAGLSTAEWMMIHDQTHYLPDDLLVKVDRATMAVSLEARAPLLDTRLVEFGWRLPLHCKLRGGRGKWLLREILARRVPRALFERPKMGFSAPIAAWLRGPLRAWAEPLLADDVAARGSDLAAAAVAREWAAFRDGDGANAALIWALLTYRAWERHWHGVG